MEEDDWSRRLREEIQRYLDEDPKGHNMTKLGRKVPGRARNLVQQFMKYGKAPGADTLVRLCQALGVSVTYIFTGTRMTPLEEEFLKLFSSLPKHIQAHYVELLRAHRRDDATPPSSERGSPQEDA